MNEIVWIEFASTHPKPHGDAEVIADPDFMTDSSAPLQSTLPSIAGKIEDQSIQTVIS